MTKIIANTINAHDHNWYDGYYHYLAERHSRVKLNNDMPDLKLPVEFHDDQFMPQLLATEGTDTTFAFTWTHGGIGQIRNSIFEGHLKEMEPMVANWRPSHLWDNVQFKNTYYTDHHLAHAAAAFIGSGYEESDILAIDGGGSKYRTLFFRKDGSIVDLSRELPVGWVWNTACIACGLENTMQSGKVMGMSGYGTVHPELLDYIDLIVDSYDLSLVGYQEKDGISKLEIAKRLGNEAFQNNYNKFDIAAGVQAWTLRRIAEVLEPLKTSDNLCVAGGVGYNGYMNEMLFDLYDNVYVPPSPGDEGQAVGVYMHADYVLNSSKHIPHPYMGKSYPVSETLFDGLEYKKMPYSEIYPLIAQRIAEGKIVGWFQDRSETGNRALGNRSILADPRNPNIKNIINRTIKFREDYRPFAPSVLVEHYKEFFDTPAPSPYMSRIVPVISDKIPGVTHVDGTARIQTVSYEDNPKYHSLINAFYTITGIPMVVNTSFNCQEPIVETPAQAVRTFKRTAIDILVINDYVIIKKHT